MLSALLEQLIERPELYQDEMAIFLYDEFEAAVTTPTLCGALASAGWSKKAACVCNAAFQYACIWALFGSKGGYTSQIFLEQYFSLGQR
jgi:flagellar motor switch protein FliM